MLTRSFGARVTSSWLNRLIASGLVGLQLALLAGCTSKVVTAPNPMEIDRSEYSRIYEAAIYVLRDYGFALDRQSHRFGIITTKELASPSAFEPWYHTNSTSQQTWESTLNSQRRRVVVSLEPIVETTPTSNLTIPVQSPAHATPTSYHMRVEVFVERLQHPYTQLSGSTMGHGIIGSLASTPREMHKRGIMGSYWRPLGRDLYLEQRLIADIVRRSLTENSVETEKNER